MWWSSWMIFCFVLFLYVFLWNPSFMCYISVRQLQTGFQSSGRAEGTPGGEHTSAFSSLWPACKVIRETSSRLRIIFAVLVLLQMCCEFYDELLHESVLLAYHKKLLKRSLFRIVTVVKTKLYLTVLFFYSKLQSRLLDSFQGLCCHCFLCQQSLWDWEKKAAISHFSGLCFLCWAAYQQLDCWGCWWAI